MGRNGWLYGSKFLLILYLSILILSSKKAKKRKLEEQFDKDSTNNAKQHERKSNIFHGISIFVDGHTGIIKMIYSIKLSHSIL